MYTKVVSELWSPASGNPEQALIHAILKMGTALETEPSDSTPSNPFQVVVNDLANRLGSDNLAVQRLRAFFAPQIESYAAGRV